MCHVYMASHSYSYRNYTRQQSMCINCTKLEQKQEVPACSILRCMTPWHVASGAETLKAGARGQGWASSSGAHICPLAEPRATSREHEVQPLGSHSTPCTWSSQWKQSRSCSFLLEEVSKYCFHQFFFFCRTWKETDLVRIWAPAQPCLICPWMTMLSYICPTNAPDPSRLTALLDFEKLFPLSDLFHMRGTAAILKENHLQLEPSFKSGICRSCQTSQERWAEEHLVFWSDLGIKFLSGLVKRQYLQKY